ncbi:hypothetical protein ACFPYN_09990 [Paenisporosarcina macmurdoensis]|uniref:Uncharacterized protein n=1 Tax=Paenisporosarcina macmurdoensis TaxID=212659 RepID=A0ABW1L707_9BACL
MDYFEIWGFEVKSGGIVATIGDFVATFLVIVATFDHILATSSVIVATIQFPPNSHSILPNKNAAFRMSERLPN